MIHVENEIIPLVLEKQPLSKVINSNGVERDRCTVQNVKANVDITSRSRVGSDFYPKFLENQAAQFSPTIHPEVP